jgi:Na+-translocating ferredoxin:NAD+ oxidoreductase RnfE subunit
MTTLQTLAQQKYNKIMMGNGHDTKMVKLYNVRAILEKEHLTEDDTLLLQQFVNATRKEIEHTSYVANTAVYPSSWGHATTDLRLKITKNTK